MPAGVPAPSRSTAADRLTIPEPCRADSARKRPLTTSHRPPDLGSVAGLAADQFDREPTCISIVLRSSSGRSRMPGVSITCSQGSGFSGHEDSMSVRKCGLLTREPPLPARHAAARRKLRRSLALQHSSRCLSECTLPSTGILNTVTHRLSWSRQEEREGSGVG